MDFTGLETLTFRIWNLKHNALAKERHGFKAKVTCARSV